MNENTKSALKRLKERAEAREALQRELEIDSVQTIEVNRRIMLNVRHGPPFRYAQVWDTVHTPRIVSVATPFLEVAVHMDDNGRVMPNEKVELSVEQVRELRGQLDRFLAWAETQQEGDDTTPDNAVN